MPPILAYWNIRGLAAPIRFLLTYCGEEFEDRLYQVGDGPEFSRACWYDVKEKLGLGFPDLPYFIDGNIKITQSNAILRYIARKHNLCGVTEEEKAEVDMCLDTVMDLRNGLVTLCYDPKGNDFIDAYEKGLPPQLKRFYDYLGNKKWLVGENITFPDFHLYEMLDQHRILFPGCLDAYKNLQQYIQRFEALPAIKAYMASDKFYRTPINNPNASVGNK